MRCEGILKRFTFLVRCTPREPDAAADARGAMGALSCVTVVAESQFVRATGGERRMRTAGRSIGA